MSKWNPWLRKWVETCLVFWNSGKYFLALCFCFCFEMDSPWFFDGLLVCTGRFRLVANFPLRMGKVACPDVVADAVHSHFVEGF